MSRKPKGPRRRAAILPALLRPKAYRGRSQSPTIESLHRAARRYAMEYRRKAYGRGHGGNIVLSEANKPLPSHPGKLRPGQALRIPPPPA